MALLNLPRVRAAGTRLAHREAGGGTLPPARSLDATRRPQTEARTLPAAFYTSADVFQLEQHELFGKMWVCVGREEDIPATGDFFTRDLDSERILVVRGEDGEIRAFFNVCRHRGARIVEQSCGQGLKRLMCPYHSWTYDLCGSLLRAPLMNEDFPKEDYPLLSVPLGTYGGFLFINLDEAADPLHEYLKDLPDLSRYRMGELRRGHKAEYEVAANWKLVCENYNECDHCALAHPQLNRISDFRSGGEVESGTCFSGAPMQLNEGFTTMSMSGKSDLPVIPGLSARDHQSVHYYTVYPNLLLSPHPDYVLVHTVWPLGPDSSRVICEWLFLPEAVDAGGLASSGVVEFWDLTNRQDWDLCERVQAGAQSRGYRPGPFQPSETCTYLFDRWYADTIAAHL